MLFGSWHYIFFGNIAEEEAYYINFVTNFQFGILISILSPKKAR